MIKIKYKYGYTFILYSHIFFCLISLVTKLYIDNAFKISVLKLSWLDYIIIVISLVTKLYSKNN